MWQPSSEAMGERECVWRFLVSSSARSELSLFFGCFVSRNRVRSEWSAASISTLRGGARVRIEWGRRKKLVTRSNIFISIQQLIKLFNFKTNNNSNTQHCARELELDELWSYTIVQSRPGKKEREKDRRKGKKHLLDFLISFLEKNTMLIVFFGVFLRTFYIERELWQANCELSHTRCNPMSISMKLIRAQFMVSAIDATSISSINFFSLGPPLSRGTRRRKEERFCFLRSCITCSG